MWGSHHGQGKGLVHNNRKSCRVDLHHHGLWSGVILEFGPRVATSDRGDVVVVVVVPLPKRRGGARF